MRENYSSIDNKGYRATTQREYNFKDPLDQKLAENVDNIVMHKGIKEKFELNNIDYNLVENYLIETNKRKRLPYKEDLSKIINNTNKYFKENYPDYNNTQRIKSDIKFKTLNSNDKYRIIDKIKVIFDEKNNKYFANTLISDMNNIIISENIVKEYMQLLDDGLWCNIEISYKKKKEKFYYEIDDLISLELTNFDTEKYNLKMLVSILDTEEWINVLLRTMGIEPIKTRMNLNEKIIFLMRLLPLVEKNFNLVELGMPGTGKSYLHVDLSTQSYLLSGAETTRAQLFYDKAKRKLGIVNNWDVVVFDEVTGVNFNENLIQYMKSYMGSGKFNANQEKFSADTSFVFNGNTNRAIDYYLSSSHLFKPLPEPMHDIAFLDRIHCYLPGWEIDFDKRYLFTEHLGLTRDFMFKFLSFLREKSNNNILRKYDIELSETISLRDRKAIKKNFSGLIKLLNPFNDKLSLEYVKKFLYHAIEMRQRVNEQQKRINKTDKFKNKKFEFRMGRDKHEELGLPEFDLYRPTFNNDRFNRSVIYSHKEAFKINKKVMENLKTSNTKNIVLQERNINFCLIIEINSIKTGFYDEKEKYISPEAEKVFAQILEDVRSKIGSKNSDEIIEKYIDTYKSIENDLCNLLEFICDNARYIKFDKKLNYDKEYKVKQEDLKNRRKKCELNHLNLNEINVVYRCDRRDRREWKCNSVRCNYGGFIISVHESPRRYKESFVISYTYERNIY